MKANALNVAAALAAMVIGPASADPVSVPVRSAPQFVSNTWAAGAPTSPAQLRGKVVVLCFWTFGCINCKHTIGYWNDWAKHYAGSDVAVVTVHTPETGEEHDLKRLRQFIRDRGLTFPVAVDNDYKIWNAYGVQAWPTEILIDKQGRIRYEYDGELNWNGSGEYKQVEQRIESLRDE